MAGMPCIWMGDGFSIFFSSRPLQIPRGNFMSAKFWRVRSQIVRGG